MVPSKDVYADKDGKITTDPKKYAFQIAVAGVFLDDRIAKRYGIADALVSVDEPRAMRKVMSIPSAKKEAEAESEKSEPAEAAEADPETEAASPEVEKPKTEAKKPAAKKGAKKKP